MSIDFNRQGRTISGGKTSPKGHICIFNANLCTKAGKFWFGDIDITTDAADLKRIAAEKGEEVFVLRERDARFANEASPLLQNSVARITPDGTITIEKGKL